MIAYASRTGTRRNLAALREAGWRLMVSARGVLRTEGFPYALDNGAWTAYQKGEPFDVAAFEIAYAETGAGADFVVVPDIVAGGAASLEFSLSWLRRLDGLRLLAVQDGMEPSDVAPHLSRSVGIFVGGETEWKERTIPEWAALARRTGSWCHVGRVNTARRIDICRDAGVHSIDGSSASRFSKNIPRLDRARRQRSLFHTETKMPTETDVTVLTDWLALEGLDEDAAIVRELTHGWTLERGVWRTRCCHRTGRELEADGHAAICEEVSP